MYGVSGPAARRSVVFGAIVAALPAGFLPHAHADAACVIAKPQSVRTREPGLRIVRQADAGYLEALDAVWRPAWDLSTGAMDMNATYRAGGQAQ